MILIDVNLLLYAHNQSAENHEVARTWLEEALSGTEPVWLAWVTILAFLRIATNPRALTNPFSLSEACEIVGEWLQTPCVAILQPGDRHWQILRKLLLEGRTRPQHGTDAHLAALAVEHGATLCTLDRDFARFPGLKFSHPF